MKLPGGAAARLVVLIGHTLLGATIALVAPSGSLMGSASGRSIVTWWHRVLLRILGVRLQVFGSPAAAPNLIVANHISWLDVIVLGAVVPGHFVAKAEIRNWPLVGWLAARAGTIYIRRGDRRASTGVAAQMTQCFFQDQRVILFPEGTSSDGKNVLPFHPRLFAAAIEAGSPVQPVALCYPTATGIHPAAPYINDDTFVPHLWGILQARGEIVAEARFLAAEASADVDPRDLAERTHAVIRQHAVERTFS